MENTHHCIN